MVEALHDEKRTKELQEQHRILTAKHVERLKEEAIGGQEIAS